VRGERVADAFAAAAAADEDEAEEEARLRAVGDRASACAKDARLGGPASGASVTSVMPTVR
jgi:hypothetical protein